MLVEAPGNPQQPTVHVEQVMEVQRAFLVVLRDLWQQHRVNGLTDDRGVDERTGVETDYRSAVVHRVEVILLRLGIHRVRAPERHVAIAGQIDLLPFVEPRRMRTHEDAEILHAWIGAAAHGLDPSLDERGLARSAAEQRRARVEHERSIRWETDLRAKRLVADRRYPIEPQV